MKKQIRRKTESRTVAAPGIASLPIAGNYQPDLEHAQQLVLELLAIAGRSCHEAAVADFVVRKLREAGAPETAILFDKTERRSPYGGQVGNLILRRPGTLRGPRRLLMAHLDTVPLCEGARPVVRGNLVEPADAKTALGADNRAGVAVVLTAALEILRRQLPHPPLVFFWTVQEEIGLFGARHAELRLLERPRLAFNFDGGSPRKVTLGATGGYRMEIDVQGIASHAGNAPERGVSAIAIASLAIAQLHQEGWHGRIEKRGRLGTSNVGIFCAGDATNVVTPQAEVRAEARSHDPVFRQRIVRALERAFRKAAHSVRNSEGRCGQVEIHGRLDYEAFRLPEDEPCVLAAEGAVRAMGAEPCRAVSNGGLDANWMTVRGIPTVTLGCGQVNAHTTAERLDLGQFREACRIALQLATAGGTARPRAAKSR